MGVNAMFLVDNNTTQILECNNKASQLFGYSSQQLLSMKMTDLSATPEATRRACWGNGKGGQIYLRGIPGTPYLIHPYPHKSEVNYK